MKIGDEVTGLDGKTYVVEVVLGTDTLPCTDCDLHPGKGVGPGCSWRGKRKLCSEYIGDKLYFKLKE